jgi:hypothetical protein
MPGSWRTYTNDDGRSARRHDINPVVGHFVASPTMADVGIGPGTCQVVVPDRIHSSSR